MPAATLSREEVIDRILQEFRSHGYDGASLARLSAATGLGRSSLYHYFPNGKEDMAKAVMTAAGEWFAANVNAALSSEGSASQRLHAFTDKISEFYKMGHAACLMDVFCVGGAAALFQPYFAVRIAGFVHSIAVVLVGDGIEQGEALRRAENAVIAIQGSLVVSRALGDNAPFLRILREMPDTLLKP